MLEAYNKIINQYSNGQYDFLSLQEAVLSDMIDTTYLSGLIRLMVNDVVESRRYRNIFAQFFRERNATGKIVNNNYINPATGEEFKVDSLSKLLDVAPADVKTSITKYNKPMQYTVDYNREELMKAFNSVEEMTNFINGLIDSLYNGAEIDQEEEVTKIFSDLYNNGLIRTVTMTTQNDMEELATKIKTLVGSFKKATSKFNSWKKLNPHDTSAKFWSLPSDINIILPVSIKAKLDVTFFATLFNVDRADLDGRIFEVDDDALPSGVYAYVFDSRVLNIRDVYRIMETPFYDQTLMKFKQVYNISEQYGVNPFANCVAIANSTPSVDITAVRSKTVKVVSGEATKIALDIIPIGGNETLVPAGAKQTTTVTYSYSEDDGASITVTATADDVITFTNSDSQSISGTITIDVI